MGLLPVHVNWEVEIRNDQWRKLSADILIFRRLESEPDKVKVLTMVDNNGNWRIEEHLEDISNIGIKPTLQLPWEVLGPLAETLYKLGINSGQDSKLAGICQAQAEHLKDLRNIALAFIGNKKTTSRCRRGDERCRETIDC